MAYIRIGKRKLLRIGFDEEDRFAGRLIMLAMFVGFVFLVYAVVSHG